MPSCIQRPARRLRFPRLTGLRAHASRVASKSCLAVNLPPLSSSIPFAYSVRPDRSDSGRHPKSRHFWTADGHTSKRFPNFVSPIWSIALATTLFMCASLHRKCKFTIDRECKRRASHSRHGATSARDVLGQACRSQSGRRLAVRFVRHRPRVGSLAIRREEVARWDRDARGQEPYFPGSQSWRRYGMAKDRPRV